MDFFSGFDDDLIAEGTVKEVEEQTFETLPREEGWFLDCPASEVEQGVFDTVTLTKHKADYYYIKKDFTMAAEKYEEMLSYLLPNNIATRRECLENIARCYLRQGFLCKCLGYCNLLHETSKTVEHLTASLSCYLDLYLKCQCYELALPYCMKLITMHKYNPHFWSRFTFCVSKLYLIDLHNVSTMQNFNVDLRSKCSCENKVCIDKESENEDISIFLNQSSDNRNLIVMFCILMIKNILNSTKNTSVGICLEDIKWRVEMVDKDIKLLTEGINKDSLNAVCYVVTKNVFGTSYANAEADSTVEGDFVDRGSSKFKNEQGSDATFESVISMGSVDFYRTWFEHWISNIVQ